MKSNKHSTLLNRTSYSCSRFKTFFAVMLGLLILQISPILAQVEPAIPKVQVERFQSRTNSTDKSSFIAPDIERIPFGMKIKSINNTKYQTYANSAERVASVVNPDLPADIACSTLDVIFVLDESGSINSTEAASVRTGAMALANALNGSGATLRLIEFSTTSSIIDLGVTTVNATFISRLNLYLNNSSGYNGQRYNPVFSGNCVGWTNWQDAMDDVQSINAELVMFFTDGNPTAYNNSSGLCGVVNARVRVGSENNYSFTTALGNAVTSANLVKGQGKHIFTIGVGTESQISVANLIAISGSDNFAVTPNIFTADYSVSDFNGLAANLTAAVNTICGTTLGINKTVNPTGVCANSNVTFTITVTNTGGNFNFAAQNVVITDVFPNGFSNLQIVAPAPIGASISGQTLTFSKASLAANQSMTIQVKALAGIPPSNFNNIASAIASNADMVQDNAVVTVGYATATDVQSACESYTWINGVTYTNSTNTPTKLFPGGSAAGCDSLVTLNLTITPRPAQPQIACYETATFNNSTCSWDVTGEMPIEPAIECYQVANFNTDSCVWIVSGSMTEQPNIACYETVAFNTQFCSWDVTGEMPIEPAIECYQVANFNTDSCAWIVSGSMTEQPNIACYETATFNTQFCSWDVTGEPNATISTEASVCDSYTWAVNGVTYNANGFYSFSSDCQNYELYLTIKSSSAVTNLAAAINEGESYQFNGLNLTSAGTYEATFENAAGCDSLVILVLTVNSPIVEGCLAAQVVFVNQGFRKDGNLVRPERSIPSRVIGAPDAQNPAIYAPQQYFFSLGFNGSIEIDFGYNIANGPGNDVKIWESSASPNAEKARIEVSQNGLNYISVGTVSQGGEVDFGGAYADYIRFVRIVDISNPAQFSNSDVSDGYDVDAVECIHGRYVQPSCVGVEVVGVIQGKQANGDDVLIIRSNENNALDLPVASPVGTVDFYALGFGGQITLAFNGPVANGPGADIRIVETTWNFTEAEYPETANVFASQDGVNFVFLGSTVHSGEFDLGPLSWAQFIKIMDASDISLFPLNADGYDVNGIECLNGSAENPGNDGLVPCVMSKLLDYNPNFQKNGDAISPMRNNPNQALGAPQGNDTFNFVSLGFGGSIELGFDFVVFNNAGNDIQVIETSFGNPSCTNYPEYARIAASIDGFLWTDLGELCLDGTIDLGSMTFAQFIRITDISNAGSSRFGASADGFDVDAVVAIGNCYNSSARLASDNNTTPDEVLVISMFPNPADDFTIIGINGTASSERISVEVFDATGRLVQTQSINTTGNQTTHRLEVSNYAKGVYMIVISTGTERFVQRLVR